MNIDILIGISATICVVTIIMVGVSRYKSAQISATEKIAFTYAPQESVTVPKDKIIISSEDTQLISKIDKLDNLMEHLNMLKIDDNIIGKIKKDLHYEIDYQKSKLFKQIGEQTYEQLKNKKEK